MRTPWEIGKVDLLAILVYFVLVSSDLSLRGGIEGFDSVPYGAGGEVIRSVAMYVDVLVLDQWFADASGEGEVKNRFGWTPEETVCRCLIGQGQAFVGRPLGNSVRVCSITSYLSNVDRGLVAVSPIVVSVEVARNVAVEVWVEVMYDLGDVLCEGWKVDVEEIDSFGIQCDCDFY